MSISSIPTGTLGQLTEIGRDHGDGRESDLQEYVKDYNKVSKEIPNTWRRYKLK